MSPRLNSFARPLSNCHFQADVWIGMEAASYGTMERAMVGSAESAHDGELPDGALLETVV
ncbi:hypothetical protein TRIATDRAFT_305935 [Trichoderma atroviride IMI 206040]|uniref:Uncharacterized protein n=1 Tax=Hypocrea atroviridis (strain ATCC 20476 / IMI 206040) TaxID=452589 RepID=G9NMR3_HYPAI|nr:uncharacterized protein TRIATDRAFT_305935 [Trichoderma atroviride IMI 206040]EHK48193.1 hypothetical protein TRIATDRAFT_305935 [Trichoderma atroviride IMI 206040]